MASARTTIVLGPAERSAARRLGTQWGVTPSEAIRRALLQVADRELSEQRERKRKQRTLVFERLVAVSKGMNVKAELSRLSEERDSW